MVYRNKNRNELLPRATGYVPKALHFKVKVAVGLQSKCLVFFHENAQAKNSNYFQQMKRFDCIGLTIRLQCNLCNFVFEPANEGHINSNGRSSEEKRLHNGTHLNELDKMTEFATIAVRAITK